MSTMNGIPIPKLILVKFDELTGLRTFQFNKKKYNSISLKRLVFKTHLLCNKIEESQLFVWLLFQLMNKLQHKKYYKYKKKLKKRKNFKSYLQNKV